MNQVKNLVNRIFLDQDNSYESPRHGNIGMIEYTEDRVSLICDEDMSFQEFVDLMGDSSDSRVLELLVEIDYWLDEYKHVQTEYQEFDWDIYFDQEIQKLFDCFDKC